MTTEKTVNIEERIFRNYLSALRQAADDVKALQHELYAIGAIRTEGGIWLYPFYMGGTERYLPREEWITERKKIGALIKPVKAGAILED